MPINRDAGKEAPRPANAEPSERVQEPAAERMQAAEHSVNTNAPESSEPDTDAGGVHDAEKARAADEKGTRHSKRMHQEVEAEDVLKPGETGPLPARSAPENPKAEMVYADPDNAKDRKAAAEKEESAKRDTEKS